MRVSAIKQELDSYGISTKTFLEKSELITALVQARKEGRTPIVKSTSSFPSTNASSASASAPTSSTTTPPFTTTTSDEERKTRIQSEVALLQSFKVSELKSELENVYGTTTKSYFEKSEFVRALAEARVDGVKKEDKKSKTKKRRSSSDDEDEEVEEVKAKVEVITNDSVGPRTKKSRDDVSSSSSGGGNPFGGGGSPFGGGGMDMGNIADMLTGMGGMGGSGGNPFGGAAGSSNPFGGMGGAGGAGGMADAMKAAQQAMSNPKVRAVIDKAQKNPKVMAAVQECMGNPMAMAKYMSDPEVGPILKELQDAMM